MKLCFRCKNEVGSRSRGNRYTDRQIDRTTSYCNPTAHAPRVNNISCCIVYVQVSCASSSTELTDRTRFPYHFGVLATEANLAFGFYSIIRHYDWRRVAILLQEENLFIAVGHNLMIHSLHHLYIASGPQTCIQIL
jgi:hypothetical protein